MVVLDLALLLENQVNELAETLVKNAATWLLLRARQSLHITVILKEFCWLSTSYQTQFKVLAITYKAHFGLRSSHL